MRILPLIAATAILILASCGNSKQQSNDTATSATALPAAPASPQLSPMVAPDSLPLIVDFSATWCRPCQMLKPIMEELEQQYAGRVEFRNIDIDEQSQLAQQMGVQAVPTLLFITRDGQVLGELTGLRDKAELEEAIRQLLNQN